MSNIVSFPAIVESVRNMGRKELEDAVLMWEDEAEAWRDKYYELLDLCEELQNKLATHGFSD